MKLYCECFLGGRYCDAECGCVGCKNTEEEEKERKLARQTITDKNPLAFESFRVKLEVMKQQRGCNCKKSQCSKKYCECFNNGVGCVKSCKCESCSNIYNTPTRTSSNEAPKDVYSGLLTNIIHRFNHQSNYIHNTNHI